MRSRLFLLAPALFLIGGCDHNQVALHDPTAGPAKTPLASASASKQSIRIGDSLIEVTIADEHFLATRDQLLAWVSTGARAVTTVYEKFPVARVSIQITAEDDDDEIHGTEYDGDLIRMRIGLRTPPAKLADDWTMTHEMLHLAFPNMGEEHLWMNEGLSVYLEPVARARLGLISEQRYWRELVEGLRQGQPELGDGGLDRTHTWGRTYWGGTIFWFLVDLRVRAQTQGRKSLDDVVKAILSAGGNGSREWPMTRVLEMGDLASGTHIMHDVYDQLATRPTFVNFDEWWQRLGVLYHNGNVTFDDAAPLAWVRKAITAQDGRGKPS